VDTRLGEARQNPLAVTCVVREHRADLSVGGESLESAVWHGVDREGCDESLRIEGVGGRWVLGAGTGPEKSLGPGTEIKSALEARGSEQRKICPVGALCDRNAEPVGELAWDLATDRNVPAADKK